MNKVWLTVGIVLLMGCAGMMPGGISVSKSDFDGSTQILMTPAFVCKEGAFGACLIKLGLHRNNKMAEDEAVMKVLISGADNFSSADGVKFNIDGEVVVLSSQDDMVRFETEGGDRYVPISTWSYKTYVVKKDFLKKLISGQRVAVRVDGSKGYVEGVFSSDKPTTARGPFGEFIQKAFEVKI